MVDALFGWLYGREFRLLVTMRWSQSPEYVKVDLHVTAHTRTQAAAKAILWAQRDVDADWMTVTVEDAPR